MRRRSGCRASWTSVDGLIIPGGESTTIVQLIDIYGFRPALTEKSNAGMPIWGTCAGMIVMADNLTDRRPEPLGPDGHQRQPERVRQAGG